jgi:hypothetical protein
MAGDYDRRGAEIDARRIPEVTAAGPADDDVPAPITEPPKPSQQPKFTLSDADIASTSIEDRDRTGDDDDIVPDPAPPPPS